MSEPISRGTLVRALIIASVLAVGAGLWAESLSHVDIRKVNDLGLISVTPPQTLVGIAVIGLGFVLAIRLQRMSSALACLAVLLLLIAVHALPSLVEDAPRQSVAYLHAGFTDEIQRTGQLLTDVDARFSWPVFFALGALITEVAGLRSPIELQAWAAPALNLLYLVPLHAIYSSLSLDKRLVWTAIFFFVATNWVGQDYYSPQGFNYLLYLTVIAILLRWFRRQDVIWPIRRLVQFVDRVWPALRHRAVAAEDAPPTDPGTGASRAQRVALALIVVLLVGVSVASHQLTPFALLASVMALTLLRRISLIGLPVLVAVLIGMWISYMTVAFLEGHLASLVADVGSVAGSASANVTRRISGASAHQFVVQARLVITAALWVLAAAGAVRRFRYGNLDLEAIALGAVPFGLMALQAYGGEMLLRVYLFSLPFVAFLAAGLFFPAGERSFSPAATRALLATAVVLSLVLMLTKHGNERADWVSAEELAAADYLHAIAPSGSTLGTVSEASPLKYQQFETYHYVDLGYIFLWDEPDVVADFLARPGGCAYVFVSRMQQATAEMFGSLPAGYWDAAKERLISSPMFSVVFQNEDAMIFELTSPTPGCQPVGQQ